MALARISMSAAGSAIVQTMEPLRMPLHLMSGLFVGIGWVSYFHPGHRTTTLECAYQTQKRRKLRRTALVLSMATAILATAITWESIQPILVRAIQ
jgi:hypothetical protein